MFIKAPRWTDIVKNNGSKFYLTYEEYKDQYGRRKKNIKFDVSKYGILLKDLRSSGDLTHKELMALYNEDDEGLFWYTLLNSK